MRIVKDIISWFDSEASETDNMTSEHINWLRVIPFALVHIIALAAFFVDAPATALITCAVLFWLRLFAITGFYHRYFSHKSFKTSRLVQFIFAFIGNMSAQRGPLWWAGHHRIHHQHSDQSDDLHSPRQRGFWWSHMGWFMCDASFKTPKDKIKDFLKYPEIVWLNRYDSFAPFLLIGVLLIAGELLAAFAPSLNTNGVELTIWGFFVSTVLLFHSTVTINSLCHVWGSRRFNTRDDSRNNALLALLTLGEGWHNNHHRYSGSTRQGFYWWEIDITYMILRVMSWLGLVWDLRAVPERVLKEGKGEPIKKFKKVDA